MKHNIEDYFNREVKPHLPKSWVNTDKNSVGYEINFTKYFYKYKPLRSIDEIRVDISNIEKELEGLQSKIFN